MAHGDAVTENEREAGAEEVLDGTSEDEDAMLHFSRYADARSMLPWEQKTRREKITYYTDRCFLVFITLFLFVLLGEAIYKIWWVSNWVKIKMFFFNIVAYLFTQEEGEKRIEL